MSEPPLRFGVVRFDDLHQRRSGYCSVDGVSSRIRSSGDLESSAVWLTNLPYNFFFGKNVDANARFRRNNYLGSDFIWHAPENRPPVMGADVVSRAGIGPDEHRRQVEFMSGVFRRTWHLAHHALGMSDVPLHELRVGIRNLMLPEDPILDDPLYKAISQADVSMKVCCDTGYSDNPLIQLSLPPVSHAIRVLSGPLPGFDARWKRLPRRRLPEKDVWEWVESEGQEGLLLASITVTGISGLFGDLVNFGSGGKSRRQWVVMPELAMLASVGEIRIHDAWICRDVVHLDGVLAMLQAFDHGEAEQTRKAVEAWDLLQEGKAPENVLREAESFVEPWTWEIMGTTTFSPDNRGMLMDMSVAAGLFAESLWKGVAAGRRQNAARARGRSFHNPFSPFIRAYDRLACLQAAARLAQMGFEIINYGHGRITVRTAMPVGVLAEKLAGTPFLPPFVPGLDPDTLKPDEDPLEIIRALQLTGNHRQIEHIDEELTNVTIERLREA